MKVVKNLALGIEEEDFYFPKTEEENFCLYTRTAHP